MGHFDGNSWHGLEERKLKEIEHSRGRRTILQGHERASDTNREEARPDLEHLIRDRDGFEQHFSNMKYYSVAQKSEDHARALLRRNFRPGMRTLDYCCGNGEYALFLAKLGAESHGVDISPEGIGNATKNAFAEGLADRCHFAVMDGENLSFPDYHFDLVVEYGALHHLDLPRAFSELRRVTAQGGRVVCIEAMRHNPFIHWYRRLTPHLRTAWEVDHILGVESLPVAREYFADVDVRFFHLASLAAVPFRKTFLFRRLRSFLEAIDDVILRPQAIGKYGWIMVIELAKPRDSRESERSKAAP